MNVSLTGTPPMPPFLLRSSAIISAATLPGTPNTDAGPERKVVMPILSSAGLSWAMAGAIPQHTTSMADAAAVNALHVNLMKRLPSRCAERRNYRRMIQRGSRRCARIKVQQIAFEGEASVARILWQCPAIGGNHDVRRLLRYRAQCPA